MIIADKVPADIKVTIFLLLISFEGFTASLDTAIHIIVEIMANTITASLVMLLPPR